MFKEHLSGVKLFVDHNTLKGFYVPTLGEGLIISSDPDAGVELMKHKWTTNKLFCIPADNEHGINFLLDHGFKEFRKASRMIMGKKIRWDGSRIYSRIGGNLG